MSDSQPSGLLTEITYHLGGIFRHMLPGVLVLGGARIAYPSWFAGVDIGSWEHLLVFGVISLAVGNTWFAFNRYGIHQFVDYILYFMKTNGPARGETPWSFLDDLGQFTSKSLHTGDASARARQHVAFRASTVLLALTVGELLFVFAFCHEPTSLFSGYKHWMIAASIPPLAVGIWQMAITRRIDYFIVNRPN
jgi:hypothetical protein